MYQILFVSGMRHSLLSSLIQPTREWQECLNMSTYRAIATSQNKRIPHTRGTIPLSLLQEF